MKKIIVLCVMLSLLVLSACSSYDMDDPYGYQEPQVNENFQGETYEEMIENEFILTEDLPVSTFSTDVDTASYANIRRFLNQNQLPPKDAVRIEEMINYFIYDLEGPSDDEVIKIHTEYSDAPWHDEHKLVMVGLKTEEIDFETHEGMNLVFLIDSSGSMSASDKLPLLKDAFQLLVNQLRPIDRISIVAYAGSAGVVLDGGDASDKDEIIEALDRLQAGGSTAGGAGIELAYSLAEAHFIEGGVNRVILASDGDFNVGMSSVSELETFISLKKESGVFLSVLGFGTGNLRDDVMESLADHGNGVYHYIDSVKEAEKVFIHQLGGNLVTVAKDVKLQIEFNPSVVKAYRLIGYENRVLNYEDFDDDEKDAGDMGSGHVVIAFYEIILVGSVEEVETKDFDPIENLRYVEGNETQELLYIAIRYKDPQSSSSVLIDQIVHINDYTDSPSETFRFASSVVEFGLLLRDSNYQYESNYDQVMSRAENALGDDPYGYRSEFITLVEKAKGISD